jgi:hypothetical protein
VEGAWKPRCASPRAKPHDPACGGASRASASRALFQRSASTAVITRLIDGPRPSREGARQGSQRLSNASTDFGDAVSFTSHRRGQPSRRGELDLSDQAAPVGAGGGEDLVASREQGQGTGRAPDPRWPDLTGFVPRRAVRHPVSASRVRRYPA